MALTQKSTSEGPQAHQAVVFDAPRFERMIVSVVDDPSDSVAEQRRLMVLGLILGSAALWAGMLSIGYGLVA